MMDIAEWLRSLGLERYWPAFCENEIDAESLKSLTNEDLKDLGVELVGHRRKILSAAAELQKAGAVASSDVPSPVPAPPKAAESPLTAERRQLTIMFVDLVGSTQLSRRVDPEQLREILRDYQNAVAGEIARFAGHVAKFMGDGILAYFGWPAAHEDEPERAVRAGLAIAELVLKISATEPLSARIGIATGLVVVGDLIGSGSAQETSVVGETPNLAARLQALAEPGTVVVSELTHHLLGRLFEAVEIDAKTLPGFDASLRAFRIIREGQFEGRFEATRTAQETPLVGRELEIELLLNRWDRAAAGEGQVIYLIGEPGIGKSRILQELRDKFENRPHSRIRYFCSSHHTQSALYPVMAHLMRAAGITRADSAARKLKLLRKHVVKWNDAPEEALPLLANALLLPVESGHPALDLAPQRQRERIFEILLEQVEKAARERPILMMLEDAQWLDPTSSALFDEVVDRLQRLPIMLVIASRPDAAPRWTGFPHVTLLTLNRLAQSHTRSIIDSLTGGMPLPASVVDRIISRTEGVPLFVEELTKTVLESGVLRKGEEGFELVAELPPLAIPSTLQDSLMARLDQLERVKDVAQIGAVIGRVFSHEILAAVAQLSLTELERATNQLVSAGMVFRRVVDGQASYTFKHALVQEAAYNSLLISRRLQLHARIAHVLERQFPEVAQADPQLLGYHFAQADLIEQAVDFYERAGRQALSRSALTESLAYFGIALSKLAGQPRTLEALRREMRIQVALGSAHVAASGFASKATGDAYKRARQCCEELGEVRELFPILYGLCLFHLYGAEFQEAAAAATELLRLAENTNDRGLLFFAHRAGGVAAWPAGNFVSARAHLEQALALYDPVQHRAPAFVYAFDPRVVCLDYLARVLVPLGLPDEALRTNNEAISEATAISHRNSLALPLFFGGVLRQILGDDNGVRENFTSLTRNVDAAGFRMWEAAATILKGWLRAHDGELDAGRQDIQNGVRGWRATGAEMMVPYFLALEAQVELRHGAARTALMLLEEARVRITRTGEYWFAAEISRLRGEAALALAPGQLDDARACYCEAEAIAARQQAHFWELRAALALASLDDHDSSARQRVARLSEFFDPNSEIGEIKHAYSIAAEASTAKH